MGHEKLQVVAPVCVASGVCVMPSSDHRIALAAAGADAANVSVSEPGSCVTVACVGVPLTPAPIEGDCRCSSAAANPGASPAELSKDTSCTSGLRPSAFH